MLSALSIAAGYAAVVVIFWPAGLLAVAAHLAIMIVPAWWAGRKRGPSSRR